MKSLAGGLWETKAEDEGGKGLSQGGWNVTWSLQLGQSLSDSWDHREHALLSPHLQGEAGGWGSGGLTPRAPTAWAQTGLWDSLDNSAQAALLPSVLDCQKAGNENTLS